MLNRAVPLSAGKAYKITNNTAFAKRGSCGQPTGTLARAQMPHGSVKSIKISKRRKSTDMLRKAAKKCYAPHHIAHPEKKSLPLSSTSMKAGKSTTSIFQTASMPKSANSSTDTLLMFCSARIAAEPPMLPR